MNSGEVLETRMTYRELSELLGTAFIEVRRGCLVSAIAVYSITDTINLNNGEILDYTQSRKNEIDEKLKKIIIKSEKLKAGNVGKNAFANGSDKVIVKTSKKKLEAYKKLLKKRGISKNASFES